MSRQSEAAVSPRPAWDGRPLRPTIATIDLAALAHNFRQVRGLVGSAGILAVVKADAYGHGAVACARVLEREGVTFFGVGLVEEGLELRDAGIRTPILVVDGAFGDRFDLMLARSLTPLVFRKEHLEGVAAAARTLGLPAVAHLKVDTGMGRVGVRPEELSPFLDAARSLGVKLEGVATHLAAADVHEHPLTDRQLDAWRDAVALVCDRVGEPRWLHAANSAGLLSRPDAHSTLVRPGILLYGAHPTDDFRGAIDLRPVLRWTTRVSHVKEVPTGTPISYGSRWVAARPSRIASLPVGYADGFDRRLSNGGVVLLRGVRVPVAGTVTMDQIMVDVTDVAGVEVGDEAVLIGAQGADEIRAEELARACGTIHYEIFCGIGPRVPRIFVG